MADLQSTSTNWTVSKEFLDDPDVFLGASFRIGDRKTANAISKMPMVKVCHPRHLTRYCAWNTDGHASISGHVAVQKNPSSCSRKLPEQPFQAQLPIRLCASRRCLLFVLLPTIYSRCHVAHLLCPQDPHQMIGAVEVSTKSSARTEQPLTSPLTGAPTGLSGQ